MAGEIREMIRILQGQIEDEARAAKENRPDPGKAWDDSVSVSLGRISEGTASATDSTRAYLAGRMKRPEPEKLSDYGQALARIRAGQGDRADSIHVGLQPRASAPTSPSYSFREGVDEQGNPVFLRGNSKAGTLEPVKSRYRPPSGKQDSGEKDYENALGEVNRIQGELARINGILNDPANQDGAEIEDVDGNRKFVDRPSLEAHRRGLIQQQNIHRQKMGTIEDRQISAIPAGPKGHKIQSPSGRTYVSDGTKYVRE